MRASVPAAPRDQAVLATDQPMSVPARHGLRPPDASSPEQSETHDPTVLADGAAASKQSRPRSGSVGNRARRYQCGPASERPTQALAAHRAESDLADLDFPDDTAPAAA
jgi:hypothetical protein